MGTYVVFYRTPVGIYIGFYMGTSTGIWGVSIWPSVQGSVGTHLGFCMGTCMAFYMGTDPGSRRHLHGLL